MTMATPLTTIGITAFNAQETIGKAIQSALDQNWPNTEIIIIDDFSTDETVNIINKFKTLNNNIQVIYNTQNQGVAVARNQIIAVAKGEFLVFFDDDDESLKERLQKQHEALINAEKKNPDCPLILCHAARLQIFPDGAQRYEPAPGMNEALPTPKGPAMAARILWGQPIANGFGSMATCAQMARLSTYKALGGFDPAFARCEDTDLAIRLALKGGGFTGTKEPLLRQIMTYGSEKTLTSEFKFTQQLYEKQKNFIESNFSYDFCQRWLGAKFAYLQSKKPSFFMQIISLVLRHPILSLRKTLWALPNYKYNRQAVRFYKMGSNVSENKTLKAGQST
jgi:glycosyltransferase involved in cell wall biosynthesis